MSEVSVLTVSNRQNDISDSYIIKNYVLIFREKGSQNGFLRTF